uniref:LOW QUALITY PROTEIN: VWFA and cache domain-containing protein 1-like n=1 Tax=Crassostrea virginica TaxID=6565 RepID=A0A8B8D5A1_CRAVI|nr:LOW QUALITY PROTEIN: VWFA and cache domain-containing protein 1-like [Crassostrea virginica]
MEAAVSSLLNFRTSTPKTPGTTSRPESPPRIASRRGLPVDMPRPRPLRVDPPAAALGAPPQPRQEDEEDIPDIPASPTASDMISTLSTYYSSEEEEEEEDVFLEYEYADPFEGEGAYSSTPPPSCTPGHLFCVPPAWGERIPGSPVTCRCVLCHEEGRHHAIRCTQCGNAPGCCACIWGYMRSRYNSGCPLCRAGDPLGEDPLGEGQLRRHLPRYHRRGRRGGMLVGIGRARGRGSPQQQQQQQQQQRPQRARRGRRGRGRGRANGRGTTIEEEEKSDVYLATVQPQPQYVVIVMDHGNSLSSNQLKTAKGIAKQFLNSLSGRDRVAVFGLASRPSFPRDPRDDSCLPNSLVPATFEASLFFSSFVDNLRQEDASTNHSLGFQTAFEMIENMIRRSKGVSIENAMILYISRGLLSSLTEGRDIMETISIHNGRLDHRVIINTYAVIDDGKHIMFEKSILQDIAEQNFLKYEVNYKSPKPVIAGMMVTINSTKDLSVSVGRFYLPLNKSAPESPIFSLPYMDIADQTLTMSISQPCFHGKELIGIMGVDLHMEDVVQDVTYYNQEINSYIFLINTDGYTIMHPSFNRPMKTRIQPMHTDIWHFENKDGFARIRSDMLNLPEGERELHIKRGNTNATEDKSSKSDFYAKYIWKRIENTTFIVVLKLLTEVGTTQALEHLHVSNDPHLVYHRLDLVQPNDMCLHRHMPATSNTSTVFLSPKSFLDPFEHLSNLETKRMVQNYVAYLKDDTRLITNPGLKSEVKSDVAATGRINTEWLRRYHHRLNHQEESIVRRYVATPSGVFRSFPGTVIDKTSDPTKTDWFQRAGEFPGHVTLTPPASNSVQVWGSTATDITSTGASSVIANVQVHMVDTH